MFATLCFSANVKSQFYTGSHQEFGKNRVQHVNFAWQSHNYKKFNVFFYGGEKQHAEFVARAVHENLKELQKFFEVELEDKFSVLVYTRYSDFKQSNLGLTNDISSNVGGKTQLIGDKLFVYFEKDQPTFEANIRAAIARLLVTKMLYGGDWKKVLRSSATLKLPDWFTEGLYSFCGESWNPEIDNIVKDGILSGRYEKLTYLEGEEAIHAGHSLWNYIYQVYGQDVIPDIIYMVNISKNFESGFKFVLGKPTKTVVNEWLAYYQKQYQNDENNRSNPKQEKLTLKKKKTRGKITDIKLSPKGDKIAYVSNEIGKHKIWIYYLNKNKYTKVEARGFKVRRKTDYSNPLLAWSTDGGTLAFIDEFEGAVNLTTYNLTSKEKVRKIVPGLSKILSFEYSPKPNEMVFSALKKGQVDLWMYNINGNSVKQLTDDFYDDLYPSFTDNGEKIIFSSNRPEEELYPEVEIKPFNSTYDLYIINATVKGRKELKRVTNTPKINETLPREVDYLKYTYIADENGIKNRYIATFDSTIAAVDTAITYRYFSKSSIVTNYKRSLINYDYVRKKNKIALLQYKDRSYQIYVGKESVDQMLLSESVMDTYFQNIANNEVDSLNQIKTDIEIVNIIPESNKNQVSVSNYMFDDDKETPNIYNKSRISVNDNSIQNDEEKKKFKLGKQKEYKVNFTIDNLTSQIDQSFLNNSYQLFNPASPSFNNPSINLFNMVELKDLMEDYRLIGGINLNFDLVDNNYLVSFEDLKYRIDKKYLFVRQSYSSLEDLVPIKTKTHEFKYRLKYPFNEVMAVAGTFSYRNDRAVVGSVDQPTLDERGFMNHLGGAKLEFIFDNTFYKGINLLEGFRYKFFAEFFHQLDQAKTDFTVIGADFRHYQKVHRDLILASRVAASTSFGNRKLIYYLGGVDNWILPRFNNNAVIPTDKGFTYQTIATPMRGFIQNSRFGNSFAVINNEFRWPIVRYFSKYPVQSNFLDNFQIVGFGDVGAAWTGSNPYSKENSFNKTIISQKPITVEIENQREPIVFGYGFGLRSQLFGYFIRFDWAWGVDDGEIQAPIRYFSLSLDF